MIAGITKYENIFRKDYTENLSRKIYIIYYLLKTNLWTYKIKNLNRKEIIISFCEKELLLRILKMSYYPETDSHIRHKVKAVLDLSSYATKKLDLATGVDTSDLTAKKDFIALRAEVGKLDIKLVNVPTSLNNLKSKVDHLDVTEIKTVPVVFKK